MPIGEDQALLVAQATAHDRDGVELGTVRDLFFDDHTGRLEWVTVEARGTSDQDSGPGGRTRFVPLASASYARGVLTLDITTAQFATCPDLVDGDHLDAAAEVQLYRHYGLSPAGDTDVDPRSGGTPRSESDHEQHSLLPPAER